MQAVFNNTPKAGKVKSYSVKQLKQPGKFLA
jgi:hypothetical protein